MEFTCRLGLPEFGFVPATRNDGIEDTYAEYSVTEIFGTLIVVIAFQLFIFTFSALALIGRAWIVIVAKQGIQNMLAFVVYTEILRAILFVIAILWRKGTARCRIAEILGALIVVIALKLVVVAMAVVTPISRA